METLQDLLSAKGDRQTAGVSEFADKENYSRREYVARRDYRSIHSSSRPNALPLNAAQPSDEYKDSWRGSHARIAIPV
jgi:hypothetical protein